MIDESCFNCTVSVDHCECGETETYSTHKPHCPYCGHINRDDDPDYRYYEDGEFQNECDNCYKEYTVDVHITYAYSCTRNGE